MKERTHHRGSVGQALVPDDSSAVAVQDLWHYSVIAESAERETAGLLADYSIPLGQEFETGTVALLTKKEIR